MKLLQLNINLKTLLSPNVIFTVIENSFLELYYIIQILQILLYNKGIIVFK